MPWHWSTNGLSTFETRLDMRVLACIITGGRPLLKDRPTRLLIPSLLDAGIEAVEYVIREDHVEAYERDETSFNVYSVEWASAYARTHWRHPTAEWEYGGFFGAFPGREWAMRTAEERGYDAVLQLDDNIEGIGALNTNSPDYRRASPPAVMVRHLLEVSQSTNAHMLGFQLNSTVPGKTHIVRAGFPYSFFLEKVPARQPYYGPFEDDIMHALEYGLNGGPNRTAAVMDGYRYRKTHGGSSGMRAHYDATRGLEISRRYPNNVRLGLGSKTSSPNDTKRGVRHFLNTRGFTPVRVTDPERFSQVSEEVRQVLSKAVQFKREGNRRKMLQRAGLSPLDDSLVDP